ncbi:MAG: PAS domain-containing protein [Parvibaculaceae bacterium]|nr:PAS domain-containing protein [Parvibaculaceae bacterium]
MIKLPIRHPDTKELFAYWSSLKPGNGQVPLWSDFSPAKVVKLLPKILVMDVQEPNLPIRLFGTGLVETLGRDMTGRDYYDLVPAEMQLAQREHMGKVISTPACAVSYSKFVVERGGREIGLLSESIHMPMCAADGHISRIVSMNSVVGGEGENFVADLGERTKEDLILERFLLPA